MPSRLATLTKSEDCSTSDKKRSSAVSALHRCKAMVVPVAPVFSSSRCTSVGKFGSWDPATITASPRKPRGAETTRITPSSNGLAMTPVCSHSPSHISREIAENHFFLIAADRGLGVDGLNGSLAIVARQRDMDEIRSEHGQ